MRIAKQREEDTHLSCCICGTKNYDDLFVQSLGIAAGMSGFDYSFCKKCWNSKNLGEKILKVLEYPQGLKLKEGNQNDYD